jgi:hypothetical protein
MLTQWEKKEKESSKISIPPKYYFEIYFRFKPILSKPMLYFLSIFFPKDTFCPVEMLFLIVYITYSPALKNISFSIHVKFFNPVNISSFTPLLHSLEHLTYLQCWIINAFVHKPLSKFKLFSSG